MTTNARYCIVGGAGFIGSHFVSTLLRSTDTAQVTVFDNFSSGKLWHLEDALHDGRFTVIRGDVGDLEALTAAINGHGVVIHLASNPDIARAATEPAIDFDQGTRLTQHVVEAMRRCGARRILYASGSGVYGDRGADEAREDDGRLIPVSTYGASKLAGEALIASYCSMFGLSGCAFRFGNVVGPRQTHGVGYDFVRRLRHDPSQLSILGDGSQSKTYIHVDDTVAAVLLAHRATAAGFQVFNVSTGDYVTVNEIAAEAIACVGLARQPPRLSYSGGDRGWKGDVPIVRLNADRIRGLGWRPTRGSREAIRDSMLAMIEELQIGRE